MPERPDYWPESAQAAAYLARVEKLLAVRGLTGAEPHLKPLVCKAALAFKTRDLAGGTAACDALADAVEGEAGG